MNGGRPSKVEGLKQLKCPQEGGTKEEQDASHKTIMNHVMQWEFGSDIVHVLKKGEDPKIPEPTDLSAADENFKWKVRNWNKMVDKLYERGQQSIGNACICAAGVGNGLGMKKVYLL